MSKLEVKEEEKKPSYLETEHAPLKSILEPKLNTQSTQTIQTITPNTGAQKPKYLIDIREEEERLKSIDTRLSGVSYLPFADTIEPIIRENTKTSKSGKSKGPELQIEKLDVSSLAQNISKKKLSISGRLSFAGSPEKLSMTKVHRNIVEPTKNLLSVTELVAEPGVYRFDKTSDETSKSLHLSGSSTSRSIGETSSGTRITQTKQGTASADIIDINLQHRYINCDIFR